MVRIAAALTFLLFAAATPAAAQGDASASATLEMRQSLTVSTARPMAPSGEQAVAQVELEKGVYEITGDPNRAYRVSTVTADGETETVIHSNNSGKILEGGVGLLDAQGRDTIRIGTGRSGDSAPQPISLTIDYE